MAREISTTAIPHKGCNSSSCCSPAKLWRNIQALIKANDRKGIIGFFKDPRQEHIIRAALTSRITNDAAMFPPSQQHKLVRLEDRKLEANRYLGKSFTDLNALQLALITSSESMVLTLLGQLKLYATPQELKLFINHIWGQGNSSLHLAVFLKRHSVVKTLMDLGCQPDQLNARKKSAIDCCYYGDQRMIELLSLHRGPETTTNVPMTAIATTKTTTTTKTITTNIIRNEDAAVKKENEIVINNDNNITTNLQQQQQQQQQTKKEVTVDKYYLLLLQLMKVGQQQHHEYAANKMILPIHNNNISQIRVTTVQPKQTFIALTQLKKPPDIQLKPYLFNKQLYDVPFMVSTCC